LIIGLVPFVDEVHQKSYEVFDVGDCLQEEKTIVTLAKVIQNKISVGHLRAIEDFIGKFWIICLESINPHAKPSFIGFTNNVLKFLNELPKAIG